MNNLPYSVKAFFEAYPKASAAYETYDGILHGSKEIALKWVSQHACKDVTMYANPSLTLAESPELQEEVEKAEGESVRARVLKMIQDARLSSPAPPADPATPSGTQGAPETTEPPKDPVTDKGAAPALETADPATPGETEPVAPGAIVTDPSEATKGRLKNGFFKTS